MAHHEQKLLGDLTKYVGAFTNSVVMRILTMLLALHLQGNRAILPSNAVQPHSSFIAR